MQTALLKTFVMMTAILAALLPAALAVDIDFKSEPQQFNLIPGLIEISGLAVSDDGNVFAHNDEHGIVYKVDAATGTVTSAFALGTPTVEADFEGIAVAKNRIYLITSDGILYESVIGTHKSRVKFNAYDTGAGEFCEVEGLAGGNAEDQFLILCKEARQDALKDRLIIYSWSLKARLPVTKPAIDIPYGYFARPEDQKKFKPSALEYIPLTGEIILVSAKGKSFYNIDKNGAVISTLKLDGARHKQPEGLALMPSGHLMISDEGKKNTPPKLTVYPPAR